MIYYQVSKSSFHHYPFNRWERCLSARRISRWRKKGSYLYWLSYKDANGASQTTVPQVFKGKTGQFASGFLPVQFTNGKLYVMNKKTGNIAIASYAGAQVSEESRTGQVQRRRLRERSRRQVAYNFTGRSAIEGAVVKISDGNGTVQSRV